MKIFHAVFRFNQRRLRCVGAWLWVLAVSAILPACGGGTNDENSTEETGQVIIGLTDAPGDFTSYTVDVVSLTLTKANGAVVNTAPLRTRVDFAQYTEMTEFFTAATIPRGTYVKATLTLDYSNADIQVEDDFGNSIPVSVVQDEQGSAIAAMDLSVRLEGLRALYIVPGIPAHLTLDFDLNATNNVDLNNGSPVVTVSPEMLAEVNVESSKIHRARGPLKSVNSADSSFQLIIRPFVHVISGGDERFGTLKVNTTADTVFDINGSVSQGAAGLTELGQLIPLTAVVVIGDLKFNPRRFEASEVRAGASIAGGSMDVVTGNVISRSGDVLTVKGATLIRQDGSVVFNDEAQVTIGDNTAVRRQHSLDLSTKDAVSVGQRISVFGTLTSDQAQNLALDATSGYAHLLFTTLRGTVVATSPLTVDVQSIDGRRIETFDFTGTGAVADADPANYEIDPGTIDVSSLAIDDVVKVRGFVNSFANTESADFTAQTIVNVSAIPGTLLAGWPGTSTSALNIDTGNNAITLNLTGTGLFHHISRAGVAVDLTQLGMDTTLAPKNTIGLYFVHQDGVWQLHSSFANYLSALQARLDNGSAVRGVSGRGVFDDNSATMTVTSMTVYLAPST